MTESEAYTLWLNRLNKIKNSEANSNGYVNADTLDDRFTIDWQIGSESGHEEFRFCDCEERERN